MPSGMFSIDSILSGRPSCKEPLLLHRSGPAVLPAGLSESLYTDYSGLYSAACGPSHTGIQPVSGGTRIGYNGYYYGQLHVQASGGGAPCCVSVPSLSPQQCPCIPAGRTHGHIWAGKAFISLNVMHFYSFTKLRTIVYNRVGQMYTVFEVPSFHTTVTTNVRFQRASVKLVLRLTPPASFLVDFLRASVLPPHTLLSLPGVSNSHRLRQRRLGTAVSRPPSDDVLHEHGESHTHRAAAPQSAALPQEAAAPNHLHRRAAGGSGGPLPGDQVPRRRNPWTTGPQGPPAGGKSGGEFLFPFYSSDFVRRWVQTCPKNSY